ncbi:MAG: hypothetical protein CME68_11585 [Halobacteriovoraceae bacterium]|nr:hypothetical protein [Halobacteriovoraceae bacterium]
MHFNLAPWSFFSDLNKNLAKKRGNFLGLCVKDPYLEALFIHFLKRSENYKGFISFDGRSIDSDWFDRNLASLDLFSSNGPIVITRAELLGERVVSRFIEDYSKISRNLVFIFSSKSSFYQKCVKKLKDDLFLTITQPRFWEKETYFRFLGKTLNIRLSDEVEAYLIKSLPDRSSDYVRAFNILRLHFGNDCQNIELSKVQELIPPEFLDSFLLADLYSQKKGSLFWKKLIELEVSESSLQEFFGFMQSHLLKLSDTSYISEKKTLNSYDKKILTQSKLWTKSELHTSIRTFGKLQVEAKKGFGGVRLQIRLNSIALS